MLLRQIGADASNLPVTIGPEGEVSVEEHPLGTLEGFRFTVQPDARAADKRMLLAAAEKRLAGEFRRRGEALINAGDDKLALVGSVLAWEGVGVASLKPGANLVRPRIILDRSLDILDPQARNAVQARLEAWFACAGRATPAGLVEARCCEPRSRSRRAAARARQRAARCRGTAPSPGGGGFGRRTRRRCAKTFARDRHHHRHARPFRAGLAQAGSSAVAARADGAGRGAARRATVLPRNAPGADLAHGFRPLGAQAVRVDLVERIARARMMRGKGAQALRARSRAGDLDRPHAETLARLMAQLGFKTARARESGPPQRWIWQGLTPVAKPKAAPTDNAFAVLAGLRGG
jgi:ATP-dependent RNA helicase SUPV3L1/SUV3